MPCTAAFVSVILTAGAGAPGAGGDGGVPDAAGDGGGGTATGENPGSENPGKLAKMLFRSCFSPRRCAGDWMVTSLPAASQQRRRFRCRVKASSAKTTV